MDDFERSLASALRTAGQDPPIDLDPDAILSRPIVRGSAPHRRRSLVLVPIAAALVVLAVVAGVLAVGHRNAAPHRPDAAPVKVTAKVDVTAVPAGGYQPNEFRLASSAQLVVGGVPAQSPTCKSNQIRAVAATRRSAGGVLGVVRLVGAMVKDSRGFTTRCGLPISHGPTALVAANGQPLAIPLSAGDTRNPPSNGMGDNAPADGSAIWGFGWFGSYCGRHASALEIPLDVSGPMAPGRPPLRVPLSGPQPACDSTASDSTLVDGIVGFSGEPVQPPRPDYASLRLTGQIAKGTDRFQLGPIELTLAATGSKAVVFDPCPAYAGRDDATSAGSGGFGGPIDPGYLPCTRHALMIEPGHPLNYTIPANALDEDAAPGSTIYVTVGVAGIGVLNLTATAH